MSNRKSLYFADRVGKEILRDPLSYIFCLGFPVVMLVIMSVLDQSIPNEANMTMFHIYNLAPGICYFGLMFLMLFISIQVSKDRNTALLLRLYASPMKAVDYILGYTVPVCVLGLAQMAVFYVAAFVIGLCQGYVFSIMEILFSMLLLIPSMLMFVGIGILFGTAVNDKAAPGLGSIIISLGGMLGGIWMDIGGIGGTLEKMAKVLPFYHGVNLARMPFGDSLAKLPVNLLLTLGFGAVFYVLAVWVFTLKMKKDLK